MTLVSSTGVIADVLKMALNEMLQWVHGTFSSCVWDEATLRLNLEMDLAHLADSTKLNDFPVVNRTESGKTSIRKTTRNNKNKQRYKKDGEEKDEERSTSMMQD